MGNREKFHYIAYWPDNNGHRGVKDPCPIRD